MLEYMKYSITIILLFKLLLANALSFKKIPLNEMIDNSEFICAGRIVNITKTDLLLQKQLRNNIESDNYKYGDPSCGQCSNTAMFVINKTFKGKIDKDTISVPFQENVIFALPGFTVGQEYILFLEKLADSDLFIKTDARFGVKGKHLKEYENLISEYLSLDLESKKRDWIIELCINPRLSWEGMLNFKFSRSNKFTENEKSKLTKGLLNMDFDNDKYLKLLEVVQEFGKNDELIEKCFKRLKLINKSNIYEGLDLMIAINELNPKPSYQRQIDKFFDGFDNTSSDSQKLGLIKEFIKEKN